MELARSSAVVGSGFGTFVNVVGEISAAASSGVGMVVVSRIGTVVSGCRRRIRHGRRQCNITVIGSAKGTVDGIELARSSSAVESAQSLAVESARWNRHGRRQSNRHGRRRQWNRQSRRRQCNRRGRPQWNRCGRRYNGIDTVVASSGFSVVWSNVLHPKSRHTFITLLNPRSHNCNATQDNHTFTSQSHVDYLASVQSQNDPKESCTPQM